MRSNRSAPAAATGKARGSLEEASSATDTPSRAAPTAPRTPVPAFTASPTRPRRNGQIHAPKAAARPINTQPMMWLMRWSPRKDPAMSWGPLEEIADAAPARLAMKRLAARAGDLRRISYRVDQRVVRQVVRPAARHGKGGDVPLEPAIRTERPADDPLVHPGERRLPLVGLDVERSEDGGQYLHVKWLEPRRLDIHGIGRDDGADGAILRIVRTECDLDLLL